MEHAKQYFDQHDTINKLYFTSDGLAFFDEQNAINHAKKLDDASVTALTREEAEEEITRITKSEDDENEAWLDELSAA